MYVMHQQWKWEEYLLLVEFAYNNGYHESLRMSPFEALCGQSCNTPISLSDSVNRVLIEPDMLADMEHEMQVIKNNLKAAHDRKTIYSDRNMLFKEFQVELDGEFQPDPQCILQKKVLMLWNRAIEQVKVQWKHFGPDEATWEMENHMRAMYPSLLSS
eukprot:PITA_23775